MIKDVPQNAVTIAPASAQVQPQLAQRWFQEATKLCERDAGRLWGVSLCGPMVIVDQATGTRATSQPEPAGQPPRFPGLVDGPVSWGGLRWFSWPLYMLADKPADVRQRVMLHGLFHRIQPDLGFTPNNGFNEHLDTLEGRVWMQLEFRALRFTISSVPALASSGSKLNSSKSWLLQNGKICSTDFAAIAVLRCSPARSPGLY